MESKEPCHNINRRKFIHHTAGIAGATLLSASPLLSRASGLLQADNITVGQIIDAFTGQMEGGTIPNTVDTLKSGSRDIVVTGVITTMFATIDVIKKAIALNANFIIAHEPTFYNHADQTDWLKDDDVYEYKAALLKEHNIAVWRNHDYIHSVKPDGVYEGITRQLGWQSYYTPGSRMYTLPATTFKQLIAYTKQKLNIPMVRYVGDPEQQCTQVLLMIGAAGGTRQINAIRQYKPDVVLCGEISEWETAEYIRDARAKGDKISLGVLGHIATEEAGAEYMLGWLKQHFPSVKATHIVGGNSLNFM